MSFEGKSVMNKAVSLNLCVLLVLAIVGWNMGLASAVCKDGVCTDPSGATKEVGTGFSWGLFNGIMGGGDTCTDGICPGLAKAGLGELPKDFKIEVTDDKGAIKVSYRDKTGKEIVGTSTLDAFSTGLGTLVDSDGNLKFGKDADERKVQVKNLPLGAKVEFDEESKDVVYTIGKGEVRVGQKDVFLQQDAEGKTILKGYKIGEETKDIEVLLGESGKLNVDSNGVLNYEGGASVNVDGISFTGDKTKKGSVEFKGEDGTQNFVVKNTQVEGKLNGKQYALKVGDGDGAGIYFGDDESKRGDLGKRWLSLNEEGVLTGDLNDLKGFGDDAEEVTFFNTDEKEGIKVDAELFKLEKGDTLEAGKSVIIKRKDKDGDIEGIVETKAPASIIPKPSGRPGLPTPIIGTIVPGKNETGGGHRSHLSPLIQGMVVVMVIQVLLEADGLSGR